MKRLVVGLTGALLLLCEVSIAEAKISVFACVPEWAALAETIGGERLTVTLASTALEDPEKLTATPGLIQAMQEADLIVCTGAGLEDSWLPALLDRAGNPNLADGQPGYFLASRFVELRKDETPLPGHDHKHFHHEGNPHVQGDPRNVQRIAAQLAKRLIAIDPEGAEFYTGRVKGFIAELKQRTEALEKKAEPLRGVRVVVQHEHSLYLLKWLGIETVTTVEPEPGVEPGPAYLAKVVKGISANQVPFVIHGAYESPAISKYVTEKAGIPLVKVPVTVGGTEQATDLFTFYEDTVDRLLDGLAGRERS